MINKIDYETEVTAEEREAANIVYNKLKTNDLFKGIYDAGSVGSRFYVEGVASVMEYIVFVAGLDHDEWWKAFSRNMAESEGKVSNQ